MPDRETAPSEAQPVTAYGARGPDVPEDGIALCLSGGGYRAMLFHLGSLWRLNELGYLPRLDRVSSVSGGSITAAVLASAWAELDFDSGGIARAFETEVVAPIHRLASKTIDVPAVLVGFVAPGGAANRVARYYRRLLFGERTLADLPRSPLFVINATNVQSGVLWRFARPFAWDYRVGRVANPEVLPLATTVAASSAFPPFLSPLVLRFDEDAFVPETGDDLQRPPFTRRVVLSDGGGYDNLGLETAWKRYRTILVSDGGGQLRPQEKPSRSWPLHAMRIGMLVDGQVRALRKRQLISSYRSKARDGSPLRRGTYWGIRSHSADYWLDDPITLDYAEAMAAIPTRLKRLPEALQQGLVNWGYAICDTAIRRHLERDAERPAELPYPELRID